MLDLNHMRTFLYRVLPWAPLGDPTAFVNLHWSFKSEQYARPGFGGRATVGIEEIVKQVQWAAQQPNTLDFYVCMSTQRICEEKQAKGGGRTYRKAMREQKNAVQLRTFWADVDVKADDAHKGATYQTPAEAAAATVEWLKVSGVPVPTLIIETGSGGLHLYWTLSEALTPEEWQPLANALAEAMRRHGFKADTGLTVDSARIMRLPGTLHSKSRKLARIRKEYDFDYTVEQMRAKLAPYYGAKVIEFKPQNKVAANDELSGGITPVSRPINLQTVAAAGCGFIGEALRTGGANYDQPLWNLTTLVATFSDNPEADAHAMSRGHPGYDQATTQELFERKKREREERDLGWPTCDAVANNGCSSCATCPIRKPGSRPLQFGAALPTKITPAGNLPAPTTGYELPDGYVRGGAKGTIHKVVTDAKGNPRWLEVCPYPISNGWVQKNPYAVYFDTILDWTKKHKTLSATHADTASGDKFSAWCGRNGLYMAGDQRKLFWDFIMAYASLIQQIINRAVEVKPFGWQHEDGKIVGFAYGGTLYLPNGEKRTTSQPTAALIEQYTPKGELKPWQSAAKIITSLKTPDRDAILAGAFAGPLVYFTNKRGLMMSTYSSDSGSFKTSTLEVAQAVWATPSVKFGVSDTNNNTLNRIGQLNSLPVFWDEIKSKEQAEKFVALTFEVTKGREKGRMASDTSLRFSGEWDTAVISATNDSLVDPIRRQTKSTTAGLHRLFEWEVPKVPPNLPQAVAEQANLRLRTNYGRAGEIYAEFLGSNIDRVKKDITDLTTHYEKLLSTQTDERFWLSSTVTLMLGAKYATELGLLSIDLKRLEDFLLYTFRRMRNIVSGSDVDLHNPEALSTILARFMDHVKPRHFLETERMHMGGRGRAPANASGAIFTDMAKVDVVWCHWGRDNKLMRVSAAVMRDWLRTQNYSTHNVMEAMQSRFNVKEVRGILGAGTPLATKFQEVLLEFDLTDPQLRNVVELS